MRRSQLFQLSMYSMDAKENDVSVTWALSPDLSLHWVEIPDIICQLNECNRKIFGICFLKEKLRTLDFHVINANSSTVRYTSPFDYCRSHHVGQTFFTLRLRQPASPFECSLHVTFHDSPKQAARSQAALVFSWLTSVKCKQKRLGKELVQLVFSACTCVCLSSPHYIQ